MNSNATCHHRLRQRGDTIFLSLVYFHCPEILYFNQGKKGIFYDWFIQEGEKINTTTHWWLSAAVKKRTEKILKLRTAHLKLSSTSKRAKNEKGGKTNFFLHPTSAVKWKSNSLLWQSFFFVYSIEPILLIISRWRNSWSRNTTTVDRAGITSKMTLSIVWIAEWPYSYWWAPFLSLLEACMWANRSTVGHQVILSCKQEYEILIYFFDTDV